MVIEKNRYLVKEKIEIGQFFGSKPEDVFITLREPSTTEVYDLQNKWREANGDKTKVMEALIDILPDIIVDHNMFRDEKSKYTNTEVKEIVLSQINLFSFVIGHYCDKVLFIIMPHQTEAAGETKDEASGEKKTG